MMLEYTPTEQKDADSICKLEFHRNRIKVVDNPFLVQREC